jgi:hypothetical protein
VIRGLWRLGVIALIFWTFDRASAVQLVLLYFCLTESVWSTQLGAKAEAAFGDHFSNPANPVHIARFGVLKAQAQGALVFGYCCLVGAAVIFGIVGFRLPEWLHSALRAADVIVMGRIAAVISSIRGWL